METLNDITRYFHKLRTNEKLEQNERAFAIGSGTVITAIGMRRGGLKGLCMSLFGGALTYIGATGSNPCYRFGKASEQPIFIKQSVLINKGRDEVYAYWKELKNLSNMMRHIKSVALHDNDVSHWEAELGGIAVSWDAEIVYDAANWRISWNSLPESEIYNSGRVDFEYAGDEYTRLHVLIAYEPKLGKLGYSLAKALNPVFEEEIREDIIRIKDLFEKS